MEPTTSSELDAGRIDRLRTIDAEIHRMRAAAGRTLWRLGALLAEVQRDELFRDAGAPSFRAWLGQHEISPRSAQIAMRVAEHLSESVAARFGSAKLDATVGWLDATAAEEAPGDLMLATIRVRGEGGLFRGVPYPQATAAEIREATRLLRAARAPQPARDRRDALAATTGVSASRLALHGDRVTVQRATLAELEALVAALRAEAG